MPLSGTTVDCTKAKGLITPASTSDPTPIGKSNYTTDFFMFHSEGGVVSLTAHNGSEFLNPGTADPGAMLRSVLTILTAAGSIVGTATEASSTLSETFTGTLARRRLLCQNRELRRAHPDAERLQHDRVFRHGLLFSDGVRHIRGAGTGDIGYVGVGRMRWRRCSPPHAPWTLKRAAESLLSPRRIALGHEIPRLAWNDVDRRRSTDSLCGNGTDALLTCTSHRSVPRLGTGDAHPRRLHFCTASAK